MYVRTYVLMCVCTNVHELADMYIYIYIYAHVCIYTEHIRARARTHPQSIYVSADCIYVTRWAHGHMRNTYKYYIDIVYVLLT
jgi:hypothetical protein